MSVPPLSPDLTREVLLYLGVDARSPDVETLDALIGAYTQNVPWESFFRIAKRARTANTADCPRWPVEFWRDAMERGGGGTCFESNYAFYSLLRALGYDGYLTVNNMGESLGCHSAIVLTIDGKTWLADAGIPLYVALPVEPGETTHRSCPYHTYSVRYDGLNRYQIERDRHPNANIYTLLDIPVHNTPYRERVTADYGENGLFLDRAIVTKIIDGQIRRFNSGEPPPHFQVFEDGQRTDYEITIDVAAAVAQHFGMDEEVVRAALAALNGAGR